MQGSLEERMARVEGILEQMDKRLGRVEAEVKELREEIRLGFQRIEDRFQRVDDRFQRMDDRFMSFTKWIITALIGSWATLMGTLIAGLILK
jgi:predicted nuclease with TOPRIM domain